MDAVGRMWMRRRMAVVQVDVVLTLGMLPQATVSNFKRFVEVGRGVWHVIA